MQKISSQSVNKVKAKGSPNDPLICMLRCCFHQLGNDGGHGEEFVPKAGAVTQAMVRYDQVVSLDRSILKAADEM